MKLKFFFFFVIVLGITDYSCTSRSDRNKLAGYMKVTKIVDGDTFWVDDGSEKGLKIRLIGVDAPETRNNRYKEKSKYGLLAKDYLEGLIGSDRVKLEYDIDKYDRYGRIFSYVYLKDGTFINA